MEIKKIDSGWEYDGIVFVDEASALAAKEANSRAAGKVIQEDPGTEVRMIYDGDAPSSFGLFVTEYLRSTDGSLVMMAKKIGVSRQTLFEWMNSRSLPSRKHLLAILAVTGCSVEILKLALEDNFEMQKNKIFEDLKQA